jgi:CRP-like cAMP-binding protein
VPFDVERLLNSTRIASRVQEYPTGGVIYGQDDAARSVLYIQSGRVKLSVVSARGKEAIVGIGKCVDYLLCGPSGCRMIRDVEVHNASTAMRQYDQHEQYAAGDCRHGEEIPRRG